MKFFLYFAWMIVVTAGLVSFCWLIHGGHPWASIIPALVAIGTGVRK